MPAIVQPEIEDLLPFYDTEVPPAQTQPYLEQHYEFSRYKSISDNQVLPPRGQWFYHQQFDTQYVRFNDSLFSMDIMGTGKTGVMISIIESLIRDPSTPYHRAYIIVRGQKLIKEWNINIACLNPAGLYDDENPEVARVKTKKHQQTESSRQIAKIYSIITYDEFVKRMRNITTDEQLQETFAGTIVYVDEFHNLRTRQDDTDKDDSKKEDKQIVTEKVKNTKKLSAVTKLELNQAIDRIFNKVYPIKRLVGTGSAIINHPADLAELVNKFLPVEQRFPTDDRYWESVSPQVLLDKVGNLFTYIRAADSGIKLKYNGLPLPSKTITVEQRSAVVETTQNVQLVAMSPWQSRSYDNIVKTRSAYRSQQRQAAIITYPINIHTQNWQNYLGVIGLEQGLKQFMQVDPNRQTIDAQSSLNSYGRDFLTQNHPIMTTKLTFIVNSIINDLKIGIRRKYYIFGYYLADGLFPLAKILELPKWGNNRFSLYKANQSMFSETTSDLGKRVAPLCPNRNIKNDTRIVNISAENRYAMIVSDANYRNIREAWNSAQNVNGDYLRVILVSDSGREGLSLTDTTRVFLLHSEWNPAAEEQALFRVIRAGAFLNLMRQNPRAETITVTIDRLASVSLDDTQQVYYQQLLRQDASNVINYIISNSGKLMNIPQIVSSLPQLGLSNTEIVQISSLSNQDFITLLQRLNFDIYTFFADPAILEFFNDNLNLNFNSAMEFLTIAGNSVDRDLYYRSAFKDRRSAPLRRMLKQIAITCPIFYKRNVRSTDKDYSAGCDYQPCNYPCLGMTSAVQTVEYTNYDLLYSQQERDLILTKIKEFFTRNFNTTYEQLFEFLSAHRPILILYTLLDIISQRIIIYNRFGYPSYLQENGHILVLINSYPLKFHSVTSIADSYYSNHQYRFNQPEVSNLGIVWFKTNVDTNLLWQTLITTTNQDTLYRWLNDLDIYSQAWLVENCIIQELKVNNPTKFELPYQQLLINKYQNQIHAGLAYPTKEIEEEKYINPYVKYQPILANYIGPNDIIIVHSIFRYELASEAKFGAAARRSKIQGRLRILRFIEGNSFRDCTDYEQNVLQKILSEQAENIREAEGLTTVNIYKIINGDLYIIRPPRDIEKAKYSKKDRRTGEICNTIPAGEIAEYLWEYQIPPPADYPGQDREKYFIPNKLQTLTSSKKFFDVLSYPIQAAIQQQMEPVLTFFYRWYKVSQSHTARFGRKYMCEMLKTYLFQNGLIKEIS